uniref:FERM domain-containing protein 8 n=1 Tax=Corvus moneduloides TaxID=1196302 RepID=A0A8U7NP49_CORMO
MDGEGEGEGASAPPGTTALLYLPDGSALPLPLEPPPGPTAAELLRRLQGALRLPPAAGDALALWLGSELLEVQLKPRHRPLRLVRHWPELLLRFSLGSPAAIAQDEPCLQLRRNVFFPKSRELELQEEELLRLLYEEAREQLQGGRYPVDPPEAAELGGLSCRLRLGPFEPGRHTELSLRPLLGELLPPGPPARWGALFRRSREPGPAQRLLEAFARAPGPEAPPCRIVPRLSCAAATPCPATGEGGGGRDPDQRPLWDTPTGHLSGTTSVGHPQTLSEPPKGPAPDLRDTPRHHPDPQGNAQVKEEHLRSPGNPKRTPRAPPP